MLLLSSSGWLDFRCWLVAQGKQVYEAALVNADSLADVLEMDDICWTLLGEVGSAVWMAQTGRTEHDYHAELNKIRPEVDEVYRGEQWDTEEKEIRRRLPRLAAMFLEQEEEP